MDCVNCDGRHRVMPRSHAAKRAVGAEGLAGAAEAAPLRVANAS